MTSEDLIYNPPPAPVSLPPPPAEPLVITATDILWLAVAIGGLAVAAVAAWAVDGMFAVGVVVGGLFVVFESWFSGLTFLKRHPAARPVGRWLVFLVALMPWIVGLGLAVALMVFLFWMSEYMNNRMIEPSAWILTSIARQLA
jgi:hypothetical protein